jgi:hypothetical protein
MQTLDSGKRRSDEPHREERHQVHNMRDGLAGTTRHAFRSAACSFEARCNELLNAAQQGAHVYIIAMNIVGDQYHMLYLSKAPTRS